MILKALHDRDPIAEALHLEVRDGTFTDVDEAARAFGLRPLRDEWRGLDRETAARVLFALLSEDIPHGSPRMREEVARAASEEFLSQFAEDSWFFTNGNWEIGWTKVAETGVWGGPQGASATAATFDGGVIVLDKTRCGVLWLEDED